MQHTLDSWVWNPLGEGGLGKEGRTEGEREREKQKRQTRKERGREEGDRDRQAHLSCKHGIQNFPCKQIIPNSHMPTLGQVRVAEEKAIY
jgi:hypothetical protein